MGFTNNLRLKSVVFLSLFSKILSPDLGRLVIFQNLKKCWNLKKNEDLLCKAVLTQQKKILHRDDIDVSKKHKKTKKIVCPSHDKHLKKIKNKKNPRCQQADFFPLLRKKKHTQKLCFFCLKMKNEEEKEIEKF